MLQRDNSLEQVGMVILMNSMNEAYMLILPPHALQEAQQILRRITHVYHVRDTGRQHTFCAGLYRKCAGYHKLKAGNIQLIIATSTQTIHNHFQQ